MPKKIVYLDYASTTPVDGAVTKSMNDFNSRYFFNPSSFHSGGVAASKALESARAQLAKHLNTNPDTIVFTSGGTEGNNLAIFGLAEAMQGKKGHIIAVSTEHASVLEPVKKLEKWGWKVTFLKVDKNGFISPEDVINNITDETVLITVLYANNEIGTIQPISDIGKSLLRYRKERKSFFPLFHTDACQAAGYLTLDVEKLHVDIMTLNSGKIYGPKGVGLIYIRRGVKIFPQILGGGQENDLRSGTENVAGIVGFSHALEIVEGKKSKENVRLLGLSEYFLKKVLKIFPDARLNGPNTGIGRLPNNINIIFPGFDGEQMVIYLDSFGVLCSTAAACSAVTSEPSHVLKAIGLTKKENSSSVRFSFGRFTNWLEIDYTINCLKKIKQILSK